MHLIRIILYGKKNPPIHIDFIPLPFMIKKNFGNTLNYRKCSGTREANLLIS